MQAQPESAEFLMCSITSSTMVRAFLALVTLPVADKSQALIAQARGATYGLCLRRSTQADLVQNSLAGEQFGGQPDHELEHSEATVPGFGEGHKTET